MDDRRFDLLARSLAAGASRRLVLKGLLGGLIGGVALGGAGKTFAQDEEPPIEEAPPSQEPVVEEIPPAEQPVVEGEPPPAEAPPAEPPPTEAPPAETPPAEVPPAQDPPAEPAVVEGTPADPATAPPALVCGEGWTPCETLCCEPGWRCCGVYCIPDQEDSCCSDSECSVCEICSLDGVCYPVCDYAELECCVDEKTGYFTCAECCRDDPSCEPVIDCEFCHSINQECCVDDKHRVTCGYCCDDSDCAKWGSCHTCYGGYCLSCFDQTDGTAPICAIDSCGHSVAAGSDSSSYCVQCCEDYQCPPCHRCNGGWCEYACGGDEQCCTLEEIGPAGVINGGYCAQCCSYEDCGDCEDCYDGHCRYRCDKGETCCHGEYCAYEHEGCCGVLGDWCNDVLPSDNLNGYCCDGLVCCYDEKSKSGSCAECCGDWDCDGGYCCGGVCHRECCDDKDCDGGYCTDDGYCFQCRDNYDCGKGEICCDNYCVSGYECCYYDLPDPVNCGDCGTCFEFSCRPTGVELYGACFPMEVAAADDSTPQLNCCDGLVCCDSHKYGLVCLECCADADCADGCYCDDGFCSCPCWSDKDCADGTCCCKNGSCSADCCPTPKPPKPPAPPKPSSGPVTTLPATGSGDSQKGSGWFGAAALGAAAAFWASRKLREDQTSEAPTPEE
ncbi:MAG: LPXTG cell wall anchor domain-containing protein [Thermomicrobiales bacterium]